MLNIDDSKRQAQSLVKALRAMGIADISSARALDVVARMNGYRNWQTAQAAGQLGEWNAVQQALYCAYPNADLLPLDLGQAYEKCGDTLFEAMMNVAKSQPLSRVIKTLEAWADVVDRLAHQVRHLLDRDEPFDLHALEVPKGLTPGLSRFLEIELREDAHTWEDVALRLETTRRDLFAVAAELRLMKDDRRTPVLLLDSCEGSGFVIPVEIPAGMTPTKAKAEAARIIAELKDREHDAPAELFDFSVRELKVKLAQAGFIPCGDTHLGPTWD